MATTYDLNAIADALAAVFDGLPAMVVDGQQVSITGHADVPGTPNVPAAVVELDALEWDATMGRGSDEMVFVVTALVATAESASAQRLLRSFLSTGGGGGQMKDALEADQTLGGLVSFAVMASARRIGLIKYNDVDYLGVELPVEVTSA